MKSIKKCIFPLAIIALILLASPGATWRGEKATCSNKIMAPTVAGTLNKEGIMAKVASLAVPFVRNAGRFNKQVRYSADLFSGRFFLTDKELVYSLRKNSRGKSTPEKSLAFKEYFVDEEGDRISFEPAGEEKGATKVSYFRGNDPTKWQSGLASFNSVSLGDIYPGIHVNLKVSGKNVEKIFFVDPDTDITRIRIGVAGVKELKIAEDGRLLFKNSMGELAMRAPIAWQEIEGQRREVKVGYHLLGKKLYGFEVSGDYDKNSHLVIDPALDTLLASTFLGGTESEYIYALALDPAGNVFVTGYTQSQDFPTTVGAFDRLINPKKIYYSEWSDPWYEYPPDVFISKFNSDLTRLLASTYLGGDQDDPESFGGEDIPACLTLDNSGNVYVSGYTRSPDFPTTSVAYDRVFSGYCDAFVAKLDGDLTGLLASTYFGGNSLEFGESLALDGSGNVYLAGITHSEDFPTTPGAYDRNISFNRGDAFISKFDGNLTKLLASTYLGGSDSDFGRSLALDCSGDVFLAGDTESADFPITAGADDPVFNSGDAFISKLNGDLTTLLASTFLGGSDWDTARRLALDNVANVYVTGQTRSNDFPTTIGAFDRTRNGKCDNCDDIFISKLSTDLTELLASTFFGGSAAQFCSSLVVDGSNNIYVAGYTTSPDFPTTPEAYDPTSNNSFDNVFISKLDGQLSKLKASTYFGGGCYEIAECIAVDNSGNVWLTGTTCSKDFPTTPGAYDRSRRGLYISKLNGSLNAAISITVASPNGGESWVAGTVHGITWESAVKIVDVRIGLSTDNGTTWSEVSVSPARYHKYAWTVPNTPSRKCLVRISDADNAGTSDTSDAVFSILMNIDLVAERREVRAFSIVRQYGRIQFLIGNASVPVAQYRLMRRKGGDDFTLLKEITPSELQNNQFQMQDKYLEKAMSYTYRVDAYDVAGQLVGISPEKTI